jgi:hypothetical protein
VPPYGKVLTEQEKQTAGDISYGPMYRRMVAGMMTLRDRGLPIFDLGDLLKDEKGTFYADDVHFIRYKATGDSPGYRLMAARVAQNLAEAWGLKPKP